jgi:hypothetical protein
VLHAVGVTPLVVVVVLRVPVPVGQPAVDVLLDGQVLDVRLNGVDVPERAREEGHLLIYELSRVNHAVSKKEYVWSSDDWQTLYQKSSMLISGGSGEKQI